jgi:CHASE2 domain-containing sensor protein
MEHEHEGQKERVRAPEAPSTDKSFRKSIKKIFLSGILITLLMFVVKWGLEHTSLYEGLQRAAYEWLQARLSPPHRRDDLPVMIVDIRDLEYVIKEIEGEKYSVTPREKLMPLIEEVAAQQPKVIALDIDFSPHKIGFLDPLDPIYFRKLAALSQIHNVPIFLGVHRSRNRPRELWLGDPEFESLGANVENPEDNRKMYEWTSDAAGRKQLTMSQALASVFPPEAKTYPRFPPWAVRQISEAQKKDGRKAGEFLVDFSALGTLEDTRLKTTNREVIKDQGWTLRDKAVLIGDGSLYDARDSVIIPMQGQTKPVPGIYLQAAAAYTLIRSPIYEVTGRARFLLDFGLALIVLGGVIVVRILLRSSGSRFAQLSATYFFIVLVTVVVVILGILLVHRTHVLWDDFAFVLLGLWFHPIVELILSPLGRAIKATPDALRVVFVSEQKE